MQLLQKQQSGIFCCLFFFHIIIGYLAREKKSRFMHNNSALLNYFQIVK